MDSTNKISISDTATTYEVWGWSNIPGGWILDTCNKNLLEAKKIFKQFTKIKVPYVKERFQKLYPDHISEVHLPLTIFALFNLYMEDQIELYQAELDERDEGIDKQWEDIKSLAALEDYKLFKDVNDRFKTFMKDFTNKLIKCDSLAEDFEQTVRLFQEAVNTSHVGQMNLISFYSKETEVCNLNINDIKENPPKVQLSYRDLESSFHILKQILYKNSEWVLKRISEIMSDPIEPRIKILYGIINSEKFTDFEGFKKKYISFQKTVKQILTIDVLNPDKIRNLENDLEEHRHELMQRLPCFPDNSFSLNPLKSAGDRTEYKITVNEREINISKEEYKALIKCHEKILECHVLMDNYIANEIFTFRRIMKSLANGLQAMSDYHKSGKMPLLAKDIPPIEFIPNKSTYNSKVEQELLKGETRSARRKKNRNGAKAKAKEPTPTAAKSLEIEKKEEKVLKAEEAAIVPINQAKTEEITPTHSLEGLRNALHELYLTDSSPFLRQAIFHLDALIAFQAGYSTLEVQDRLNYLTGIVNGSGKLLEQTYHYLLAKQGLPTKTHNLKENHRNITSGAYPKIVDELRQSNMWTRYFYNKYDQYSSVTTTRVSIPQALKNLRNIAENPGSMDEQKIRAYCDYLIRNTCLQVSHLLSFSNLSSEEAMGLNKPSKVELIETVSFSDISKRLARLLKFSTLPSNHPTILHIKQARAALSMLESSLDKLNHGTDTQALATWVTWSLQQLNESIEDVLHGIEFLQTGRISGSHDLKTLASSLGLNLGTLAQDLKELSYKPRYPAENSIEGKGAEVIDEIETFRVYPDLAQGFEPVGPANNKLLLTPIRKDLTLSSVLENFTDLLSKAEDFLNQKALPTLEAGLNKTQLHK